MAKKQAAPKAGDKAVAGPPAGTEPQKSKKIPKLAKKNKRRLPRKEKKAKQKAALKA